MSALVRYEAARSALAEAHRIDEVKDIRDKAEAMAAYARQAKDSELIQYATEIARRAERRCGELLIQTERNKGATVKGGMAVERHDTHTPTLADMGLTRDESSRYQQLAAMPDEHFETAIATAKATAGEITTAFMLRQAKEPAARRSREERLTEMTALVHSGHNVEQIADMQGVDICYVRSILNGAGIKFSTQKRTRSIDSNRIVRESVATLSGITQGLSLARGIDVDPEEARDMLVELKSAMRALRVLSTTLQEIANGQ